MVRADLLHHPLGDIWSRVEKREVDLLLLLEVDRDQRMQPVEELWCAGKTAT
jgi:hypothetical protein